MVLTSWCKDQNFGVIGCSFYNVINIQRQRFTSFCKRIEKSSQNETPKEDLPCRSPSLLFLISNSISVWIFRILVCRREVYPSFLPPPKNTSSPLLQSKLLKKWFMFQGQNSHISSKKSNRTSVERNKTHQEFSYMPGHSLARLSSFASQQELSLIHIWRCRRRG